MGDGPIFIWPARPIRNKDAEGPMSLLEVEPRRSRRKQTKQRKQRKRRPSALAAPLSTLNDNQVLTFAEWCRLNSIGLRTGRRILRGPTPPKVVQLTTRRIGITVRANREWQQSRSR